MFLVKEEVDKGKKFIDNFLGNLKIIFFNLSVKNYVLLIMFYKFSFDNFDNSFGFGCWYLLFGI